MKCFLDFNTNTTPTKQPIKTRQETTQPTVTRVKTKMFCKVCKDAGKKEADYTSHWVRDAPGPKGKVVCPTLLSTQCKYCKKYGHIIKFCPKLKGKYWDNHNPSYNNISTVKVTYKSTPSASQEAQEQKDKGRQERARELCSSPPPAPETVPTPFRKKNNYFRLLKVDEEDDEKTTSVIATLKPDYLAIAKSGVEKANREWEKTKETQIQNYQKDLKKNFPTLGEEKTMKIVNAIFPATTTATAVKSYCSVASTAMKYERADSPTPSPVSSRPTTPPPAPKKMPRVKEEESSEAEQEEKLCCGGCKRLYEYGCSEECKGTPSWEEHHQSSTKKEEEEEDTGIKCTKCIPGKYGCSKCYPDCPSPSSSPPPDCLGTPSLSPTPSPPPTTTTTSWADMEM